MENREAKALNLKDLKGLNRAGHSGTDVAVEYNKWREDILRRCEKAGVPFVYDREKLTGKERLAANEERVNRQVALAVYSDLRYNHGYSSATRLKDLTGKSAVYWNFTLLGTTEKTDKDDKDCELTWRVEQKVTDYFVHSLLNHLAAAGVFLNHAKLADYLAQARWRVIAEPQDKNTLAGWRDWCRHEGIEEGVDYPSPWFVSNWAGEHDTPDPAGMKYNRQWKNVMRKPGRVNRGTVRAFGLRFDNPNIVEKGGFSPRPRILEGAGNGWLRDHSFEASFSKAGRGTAHQVTIPAKNVVKFKKPELENLAKNLNQQLDEALAGLRGLRLASQAEVDRERDKRDEMVKKYEKLLAEKDERIKELEKENEAMLERGKKYAEVLGKINKLSWTKGIK